MASEKQIRANRANARKSTGPKTAEGKARSRLNAYKHGMAAADTSQALPPEDLALFQERLGKWLTSTQANGDLEHYLVATAVVASIRMDRCARHEFARVGERRRAAERRWQGRRAREADALGERLLAALPGVHNEPTDDPIALARALRGSVAGCDWLIDRWDELAAALETPGHWNDDQLALAETLLASGPLTDSETTPGEAQRVTIDPAALRELAEACRTEAEDDPAGAEAARQALWVLIQAEAASLAEAKEDDWHRVEAPALTQAIDLAVFDDGRRGQLGQRYASACALMFQRALNQLVAQKQERRRIEREREEKGLPSLACETALPTATAPAVAMPPTPRPTTAPAVPIPPERDPDDPAAQPPAPQRNEANSEQASRPAASPSVNSVNAPDGRFEADPTGPPDRLHVPPTRHPFPAPPTRPAPG